MIGEVVGIDRGAVARVMHLLAQAHDSGTREIQQGYGGLVFMGCFFLVLIFVGIWWLKRQS